MPKQAGVLLPVVPGKSEQKHHCKKVVRTIAKINRLTNKLRNAEDKLTMLLPQSVPLAKLASVAGKLTKKRVASILYPA